MDNEDGSNALILPAGPKKKTKKKKQSQPSLKPKHSRLSKSQQRKLKKLQEVKEKKDKSSEILATLENYKLAEDTYALLHASGTRGQRESMREKLRRAINYERAGLKVPSEVPLLCERTAGIEELQCIENDKMMKISMDNEVEILKDENGLNFPVTKNSHNEINNSVLKTRLNVIEQMTVDYSSVNNAIACKIDDKLIKINHATKTASLAKKDTSALVQMRKCDVDEVKMASPMARKRKKQQDGLKFTISASRERKKQQKDTTVSDTDGMKNSGITDSDIVIENADKTLGNAEHAESVFCNSQKDTTISDLSGMKNAEIVNVGLPVENTNRTLGNAERAESVCNIQDRSKVVIHISRSEDVEKSRQKLPIIMMEQEIMEGINENPVTIVCGETGCGKTTQVPQFLYEAGFSSSAMVERSGMIGITQPRRVAVIATAKRLSQEMNLKLGHEIGFQVRHDKQVGEKSRIKFMTDGILLREVQSDFLLRKYSVIVLDEAHERSLNTDILIGMLSRVLRLRQALYEERNKSGNDSIFPMKLVIMSATLRVDEFVSNKALFPCPPPVVNVPTRQFPVTIHFSAKTEIVDYVGKAYKKVCAIHKNLPAGGVLVFLTGQAEVHYLCKRLQNAFPDKSRKNKSNQNPVFLQDNLTDDVDYTQPYELDDEVNGGENWEMSEMTNGSSSESDLEFSEDDNALCENDKLKLDWDVRDDLCLNAIKNAFDAFTGIEKSSKVGTTSSPEETKVAIGPLHVLPLYALLPAASQLKVFEAVPEGSRLVVVATNVAETSITIPGIRYVVDCGRAKEKIYERESGIAKYEVRWISKASAAQRAGRAGRTGPGHCYRLYSSAVFNDTFPEFALPEIHRAPIEGLVLLLKCMGIVKVNNFPFLSQPDKKTLSEAEQCLYALSALDPKSGLLTPMGQAIAFYPIGPRHARMLLTAMQTGCGTDTREASLLLAYAAAVVAALSLDCPFMTMSETGGDVMPGQKSIEATQKDGDETVNTIISKATRKFVPYRKYSHPLSDPLSVVRALHAYEISNDPEEFCVTHHMHARIIYEMSKLRKQIVHIYAVLNKDGNREGIPTYTGINTADVENVWKVDGNGELSMKHERLLRQAICAGWADRVARKVSVQELIKNTDGGEHKKHRRTQYQACNIPQESVYIHPSSSLRKQAPEYVVYNEVVSTSKLYMKMITSVEAHWLVVYANTLCTFSKPLSDPPPWYDAFSDEIYCWVSPSFGPHLWRLPLHEFPLKSKKHRVSVFARALLQGKVIPVLKGLSPHLSADPSTILLPASNTQKRVSYLLHALDNASIDSRQKLKAMWETQADFLFEEMLLWVQKKSRIKLQNIWATMKLEIGQSPNELFKKKMTKKSAK